MARSQTVIVTHNGRDGTVMIPAEEYQRMKRRDRQVYAASQLPDEIVEAVLRSEMDSGTSISMTWSKTGPRESSRAGTGLVIR